MKQAALFILLFFFLHPNATSQQRVDTTYNFKARLTKAVQLTPFCGTIAWAIAQKFEVISTDFPGYKNKYVVVIQPCPEFLGKNFFKSNTVYNITVADSSGAKFGYSYTNIYQKENIPTFWSREINRSK